MTHVDLALLRFEVPLDAGVRVGVERDPDDAVPYGLHAFDPLRAASRARRPAEPCGLSGKGSEGPAPAELAPAAGPPYLAVEAVERHGRVRQPHHAHGRRRDVAHG